jgi:hypothetical protein
LLDSELYVNSLLEIEKMEAVRPEEPMEFAELPDMELPEKLYNPPDSTGSTPLCVDLSRGGK